MTMRLRSFLLSAVLASCFVLCLPLSSAYALLDDYDIQDGEVHVSFDTYYDTDDNPVIKTSGWKDVGVTNFLYHTAISYSDCPTTDFISSISIRNDTEPLFAQNETALLTFDGLTTYLTAHSIYGGTFQKPFIASGVHTIQVVALSSDKKYYEVLENAKVDIRANSDGTFSISLNSGSLPFPVCGFSIHLYYDYSTAFNADSSLYIDGSENTYELTQGWTNHKFNYSYFPSSTAITNDIKETVTEVKEEIIEVKDSILALPGKLAESLIDMLIGLFIPSEETMNNLFSDFTNLFMNNFGALGQVFSLVFELSSSLNSAESHPTIDFPLITIPLGDVDFEFGGWTVQVVPDGFEFIFDALKMVVSIACSFLFIFALKTRMERIFGGDPNA